MTAFSAGLTLLHAVIAASTSSLGVTSPRDGPVAAWAVASSRARSFHHREPHSVLECRAGPPELRTRRSPALASLAARRRPRALCRCSTPTRARSSRALHRARCSARRRITRPRSRPVEERFDEHGYGRVGGRGTPVSKRRARLGTSDRFDAPQLRPFDATIVEVHCTCARGRAGAAHHATGPRCSRRGLRHRRDIDGTSTRSCRSSTQQRSARATVTGAHRHDQGVDRRRTTSSVPRGSPLGHPLNVRTCSTGSRARPRTRSLSSRTPL